MDLFKYLEKYSKVVIWTIVYSKYVPVCKYDAFCIYIDVLYIRRSHIVDDKNDFKHQHGEKLILKGIDSLKEFDYEGNPATPLRKQAYSNI